MKVYYPASSSATRWTFTSADTSTSRACVSGPKTLRNPSLRSRSAAKRSQSGVQSDMAAWPVPTCLKTLMESLWLWTRSDIWSCWNGSTGRRFIEVSRSKWMTCGFSRTERHHIVPIFVWTGWGKICSKTDLSQGSAWMDSLQSSPQSVRFLPLGIFEAVYCGNAGPTEAKHCSGNYENRIRSYWSSDVFSEIARSWRPCRTWRMDRARAELRAISKIATERTIPDQFRRTQLKWKYGFTLILARTSEQNANNWKNCQYEFGQCFLETMHILHISKCMICIQQELTSQRLSVKLRYGRIFTAYIPGTTGYFIATTTACKTAIAIL